MSNAPHEHPPLDAWLIGDGLRLEMTAIVASLAHRLVSRGVPLARMTVNMPVLNPSVLAAGFVWRPDEGVTVARYDYDRRDSGQYERSPFKVVFEDRRRVLLDIANTPDDAFGIVPELREAGIAHYHAIPLTTSRNAVMALTISTTAPDGFSAENMALIDSILPALSVVAEIKTLNATFRDVLAAYVGREPALQIIDGSVHRGEVTHVRAAIFVADLRGFTHLSTQLPPEATADVINRYYDVVVPQVEARGGEILKFIGDAVLAIFRIDDTGDEPAVLNALDAARDALSVDVAPYEVDGRTFDIRFGVAIHVGDAVYGNVGSGDRLDFTVIGRDVNVAARIAALCSRLGREYLVSEEVAAIGIAAGRKMAEAGAHDVRGIAEPVAIFVPDADEVGPEHDDGVSQGLLLAPTV